MQAWRRCSFFLFLLPLSLLPAAGCRSNSGILEDELRNRDQMYKNALLDQHLAEDRANALQQENIALRRGSHVSPEEAAQIYGLKRIVLGRMTGGYDQDNQPGDELLQVVVEPRDSDDHTIKTPGTLYILALEVNPQGIKMPLCSWEITPDKLRQSWKQGLLSVGYTLMLPWKRLPIYENVRVVARLVTPDGRVFEADKDVKVRLVPGAAQKRCDLPPDTLPPPTPFPTPEPGPSLIPMGTMPPPSWPTEPHTTQWRPLYPQRPVTIGRPVPLGTPAPPPIVP